MNDQPTPGSTRREGVPCRLVRLSDGADWGLMRPTVLLRPKVRSEFDRLGRPVERVSLDVGFGYPRAIESLIDALREACEGGQASQQYGAFFSLALALLRKAHDLEPSAACELLSVTESELPRLVRDVLAVISESKEGPDGAPTEVQSIVSQ